MEELFYEGKGDNMNIEKDRMKKKVIRTVKRAKGNEGSWA